MKTKSLFLGLGIVAGALVAATALNKKNVKSVKEFVSKKLKMDDSVSSSKDGDINYV